MHMVDDEEERADNEAAKNVATNSTVRTRRSAMSTH